jgi:hypothetical protein
MAIEAHRLIDANSLIECPNGKCGRVISLYENGKSVSFCTHCGGKLDGR